jgi:hypothetical protein
MSFIKELQKRNPLLFWFGLFNLFVAVACLILMQTDTMMILGVNRWLKPFKFYSSVGIMILTMGWLMHYLNNKKQVRRFSILFVLTMLFENGLILMQAIRGTTSHFNISSAFNIIVFDMMGILIAIFTIVCIILCVLFFRQKEFTISVPYVWGIRLGILFFIFFSLEGGAMLSILRHTVGAPDGGPGLPVTNWSSGHGDLRIAHFLGIHSLQILPLIGYYISKSKKQLLLYASVYFVIVIALLAQALADMPLVP